MANWTRQIKDSARGLVNSTSRYAKSKVIHYTEDKYVTFEIYKRKETSTTGEWLEITKPVEYRPDLVSQELYGSPDFWWRIMEHNHMKDILEFKAGVNIRIPGDVL